MPRARLWKPAAVAARCSASSRVSEAEAARARPSRERITALSTSATRVTRSSRSQLSPLSKPGPRRQSAWSMRPPVLYRRLLLICPVAGAFIVAGAGFAGLGCSGAVRRPRSRVEHRPAPLPALLYRRHRGPGLVGGTRIAVSARQRWIRRRGVPELWHQAGLAYSPGQYRLIRVVLCLSVRRGPWRTVPGGRLHPGPGTGLGFGDRKSTRLNSSHPSISYA